MNSIQLGHYVAVAKAVLLAYLSIAPSAANRSRLFAQNFQQ